MRWKYITRLGNEAGCVVKIQCLYRMTASLFLSPIFMLAMPYLYVV